MEQPSSVSSIGRASLIVGGGGETWQMCALRVAKISIRVCRLVCRRAAALRVGASGGARADLVALGQTFATPGISSGAELVASHTGSGPTPLLGREGLSTAPAPDIRAPSVRRAPHGAEPHLRGRAGENLGSSSNRSTWGAWALFAHFAPTGPRFGDNCALSGRTRPRFHEGRAGSSRPQWAALGRSRPGRPNLMSVGPVWARAGSTLSEVLRVGAAKVRV